MQQTMFIVRVGNDVRFFNNGKVPFACVSVAENQYYRDRETGNRKQYTTWIPVIGYGSKAEFMRNHLIKGSLIGISGIWRNMISEKDGKKQYWLALRLQDVKFLSKTAAEQDLNAEELKSKVENDGFVHVETTNQPFGEDFSMPAYVPGLDDEE